MATFHGWALTLLKEFSVGKPADYPRVASGEQQVEAMRGVLLEPVGAAGGAAEEELTEAQIKKWLSRCKRARERASGEAESAETQRISAAYSAALDARGLVELGDLVLLAVQMLTDSVRGADCLAEVRAALRHLVVDEFQDVTWPQLTLLQLLIGDGTVPAARGGRAAAGGGGPRASPGRIGLTVVGDDDQSIFGFSGALPETFAQLARHCHRDGVPHCQIVLQTNYRNSGVIVRAASSMIQRNTRRVAKKVAAAGGAGSEAPVTVAACRNAACEAAWLVEQLRSIERDGGSLADCAVLYRINAAGDEVAGSLREAGVPIAAAAGSEAWAPACASARLRQHLAVLRWVTREPKAAGSGSWIEEESAAIANVLGGLPRTSPLRVVGAPSVAALRAETVATGTTRLYVEIAVHLGSRRG